MSKLSSVAALFCAAGMSASVHGDTSRLSTKPPPEFVIGISNAVCLSSKAGNSKQKQFFKMAAAKNELTPFGTLPEATKAQAGGEEQPLWDNLGDLTYPITTNNPQAQKYFDQGLRLSYGFNHEEALRSFRMAQKIDPSCAMCHWGEALVLGPNINMPMDAAANQPAVAAMAKAKSHIGNAKPNEQALIRALAARYSDAPGADRKKLDGAYADAMKKVSRQYPSDPEIGVLYAEALMNLSPWDYWDAGGAKPKGKTAELVATLERVLKANPDHPGAIHYYIHTVEASTDPGRAEAHADRLGKLMPGAGHLVHMPSHIYYRVGRYKDSLAANVQAVAVDEAYIAENKPAGVYPLAYYPHNVHFVLVSAQMAGDGKTVIDSADKLSALVTDETAKEFPIAQPVRVAPYFAHAQFSDPDTILALPAPQSGLPYVKGVWHYARGVAYAAKADLAAARKEAVEIDKLRKTGNFTALTDAGIPAPDVLRIAGLVIRGRVAQSAGDYKGAANHFERAVALEDRLNYMEPAYWYYPVRQSLGAVLLQKGDLDGAEKVFRASLVKVPNNGWSLYGLSEVYRQRGNAAEQAAAQQLLDRSWLGDREQLSIAKL